MRVLSSPLIDMKASIEMPAVTLNIGSCELEVEEHLLLFKGLAGENL